MELNFLAILVAAIVPLVLGFIWYGPMLFQNAWMRESGMTEEKMKNSNMAVIFLVSLLLSVLLAFFTQFLVIHQFGAMGMVGAEIESALPSYQAFMDDYGNSHRSFSHGALHGAMAGIFFVLPVMATNGLFERKSWKLTFINVGYWTLCLAIMGAIICGWQ
ncbi:DUF1761 domain-containing protein [Psychroserpens sp.]|uniref:DUF1761 domain-containing protein n=1 Tax=Psychroserpens sp. TaxID=2020870 RepID=UPI001B0BD954|nr:DUF1761 domain-containing protein [Psychroserpens sp.]MBO6605355.1 DUF1761 domain-containing protein [Psychroserpens sp.]MBO6629962.1 DUF1761 domain-containing protein [Psychroserpens sp.]MBO6653836.1 DUF1761 domain-containing protein [Psychroserpens sp.]MBO6682157.1 DUF1761 domain-containing protein [Psychroserpens sp.]MBO6748729.1 DUF1761 domain-containing protein [Psychroserpens sp.]